MARVIDLSSLDLVTGGDDFGGGDYGGGGGDYGGGGGDYGGGGGGDYGGGGGETSDYGGGGGGGETSDYGGGGGGDYGGGGGETSDYGGGGGGGETSDYGGDWGDSTGGTGDDMNAGNTLGGDVTGEQRNTGDQGNTGDLAAQAGINDIENTASNDQRGTPTADGGHVVETRENYTWMGMTYEQTVRQTYDAGGNLVSTQTDRPGTVWSDSTVVDNNGTRTTYDAGGNGLAGQVTTSWDSNGNLTGINGRGEAAFGIVGTDYTVNAGVQAGANITYGDNGSVATSVNAGGNVNVTHDPTGWGVSAGYEINGNAAINYDSNGQFQSFNANGSVDIPLSITQNGQEVAGVTLHPAQVGVGVTATDNGYDFGASAAVNVFPGVQVGGYVGGSYDTGTGQLGLDAGGQVKVFGQEIAGVSGSVYDLPGGGIGGDLEVRGNVPDLSQMPDINWPDSFPDIPLPPMPSFPTTVPSFEGRPTNLPGNWGSNGGTGNTGGGWGW